MRLLYITKQRQLQNDINDLIVQIQDFTADPQADTSLGKVGR